MQVCKSLISSHLLQLPDFCLLNFYSLAMPLGSSLPARVRIGTSSLSAQADTPSSNYLRSTAGSRPCIAHRHQAVEPLAALRALLPASFPAAPDSSFPPPLRSPRLLQRPRWLCTCVRSCARATHRQVTGACDARTQHLRSAASRATSSLALPARSAPHPGARQSRDAHAGLTANWPADFHELWHGRTTRRRPLTNWSRPHQFPGTHAIFDCDIDRGLPKASNEEHVV